MYEESCRMIEDVVKFKLMLKALSEKDYVKASEEGLDSRWAKQVYNRAHRLMDRLRSIDDIDNV